MRIAILSFLFSVLAILLVSIPGMEHFSLLAGIGGVLATLGS